MYADILLAVDLDRPEAERRAVEAAVALARAFDATLHLVAVVPSFGLALVGGFFPKDFEAQALARADAELHAFAAREIPPEIRRRTIVAHGRVYQEILRWADVVGADLVVASAHRPDLEDYLLGPNAARIVRHAKCSTLVVRDPPITSP